MVEGGLDGPLRASPRSRLRGRSPRSKRNTERSRRLPGCYEAARPPVTIWWDANAAATGVASRAPSGGRAKWDPRDPSQLEELRVGRVGDAAGRPEAHATTGPAVACAPGRHHSENRDARRRSAQRRLLLAVARDLLMRREPD